MTTDSITDIASEVTNPSQRLAELLEFEIQRIQAENARPGWSRWALLGALAASAWLALGEVESRQVDLPKALLVALVVHLLYDLLVFGSCVLTGSQHATQSTGIRFRSTSFLGQGRVYMVANFARYAALLGIALVNPLVSAGGPTLAVYAVPSFVMVFWVIILVLSFVHAPLPPPPTKLPMGSVAIYVTGLAVIVTAFAHLSGVLFATLSPADIPSIRVGALIVVIGILACLLARETFQPALLTTLIDVRREFGLDEIDYATARRQTNLALKGMTISDIFQEQAKRILEQFREITKARESARSQIKALRSSLASKKPTEYGEEEISIVEAIFTSTNASLDNADKAIDKAKEERGALVKQVRRLQLFAPHASADLRRFLDDLQGLIDEEKEKILKLSKDTRGELDRLRGLVCHAESERPDCAS